MIIKPAETYKRVAAKYKLDRNLVASIGEAVFTELLDKMLAPDKLAYELDHVGTFAVRHQNFWRKHNRFSEHRPESDFLQRWSKVPDLIEDFKRKRDHYKGVKDEYKKRTQQSSQD